MLQLARQEFTNLMFQIGTSSSHGGRRKMWRGAFQGSHRPRGRRRSARRSRSRVQAWPPLWRASPRSQSRSPVGESAVRKARTVPRAPHPQPSRKLRGRRSSQLVLAGCLQTGETHSSRSPEAMSGHTVHELSSVAPCAATGTRCCGAQPSWLWPVTVSARTSLQGSTRRIKSPNCSPHE